MLKGKPHFALVEQSIKIRESTGERTATLPPPPPPLIDYFLFINGPEHAINWLMICPRNKLTDKQSNWYVTNFNSIHATKFVARFNLVDYTIDSFRLCKYNNFDNLWKLYIYISRVLLITCSLSYVEKCTCLKKMKNEKLIFKQVINEFHQISICIKNALKISLINDKK